MANGKSEKVIVKPARVAVLFRLLAELNGFKSEK